MLIANESERLNLPSIINDKLSYNSNSYLSAIRARLDRQIQSTQRRFADYDSHLARTGMDSTTEINFLFSRRVIFFFLLLHAMIFMYSTVFLV